MIYMHKVNKIKLLLKQIRVFRLTIYILLKKEVKLNNIKFAVIRLLSNFYSCNDKKYCKVFKMMRVKIDKITIQ